MNFKGFQLHIRNIGDQFDFDLKFRRCICTFFPPCIYADFAYAIQHQRYKFGNINKKLNQRNQFVSSLSTILSS